MKNYFLILLSTIVLGCMQPNKYDHLKEIVDDSLKTTINKYIEETSLSTKKRFVFVECIYEKNKVVYEISAGMSKQSYRLSPPDYISTINDVVVLLTVTDGKTIKMDEIGDEIDRIMSDNGIRLENEMLNYDPPLWTLVKCDNKYNLITKSDGTILEYLPCEYFLKMDWSSDTIIVKRRN